MTKPYSSVIIFFVHKHTNYYLNPLLFYYVHTNKEIYSIKYIRNISFIYCYHNNTIPSAKYYTNILQYNITLLILTVILAYHNTTVKIRIQIKFLFILLNMQLWCFVP